MGSRDYRTISDDTDGFPTALADWIDADDELLRSLVALRRLGDEGSDAVEAVSAIKRVVRLRLSWELWAALAEGDGTDPEKLLARALPLPVLDTARYALWGSSWGVDEDIPVPRSITRRSQRA